VPISYLGRTYREGKKIGLRDAWRAVFTILKYWIVDDVYADDAYGSNILRSLERAGRINRWLAETIAPFVGTRVLEIGAGIGNVTTSLIPRDRYVASDVDPLYLHYLRQISSGRPYLRVERIDVEEPADFVAWRGAFDTVVCINVLEHVTDPVRALENLHSALAPGGRLVLYVPRGERLYSALDEVLGHRCRYEPAVLRRELERCGFTVESCGDFNRAAMPGWWWNGRVLRRRRFSRLQLKAFDVLTPIVRRLDRFLPWQGLGLIAIARRSDARSGE
jgi:SAM-dependent methyltransferase